MKQRDTMRKAERLEGVKEIHDILQREENGKTTSENGQPMKQRDTLRKAERLEGVKEIHDILQRDPKDGNST
ncbi:hypothetical protein PoB_006310800 [Plakobranchus ocellatus]|uniref:Uncharacterized protein n=1 Tax=Plakobranchus ocellatus TaxID=259542 RepID=A0AAV4CXH0_9GAST|nr:hypothetical protein PoB_006310800 [Plakobranchus ocellatus]